MTSSNTESLVARLVALGIIGLSSLLGVSVPLIVQRCSARKASAGPRARGEEESLSDGLVEVQPVQPTEPAFVMDFERVVKLLAALGCGAILTTGTIHIAPNAHDHFQKGMGGSMSYPYPMLVATVSIILLYVAERELVVQLGAAARAKSARADGNGTRPYSDEKDVPLADAAVPVPTNNTESAADDATDAAKAAAVRASITTHVLETGVAVHSVLIGFALGMLADPRQALDLGIALVFHQFCEGCAVGAVVLEAQLPRVHTAVLWAIFACTTPLGVALGIAVEQAQGSNRSAKSLLAQGVLESMAVGVLLFMALVDMLPNLFSVTSHTHGSEAPTPGWYRRAVYAALATGCGVMSLMAVWA